MEECKTVPSQCSRDKIVVKGFLMVKDKNRNDLFYWNCDKKVLYSCKGRASTIMINGKYKLRNYTKHNHAPEASREGIAIANATVKGIIKVINTI